ncbi:MAG: DUF4139 domain-containing protein, partial [Gemmataceae bacterium]
MRRKTFLLASVAGVAAVAAVIGFKAWFSPTEQAQAAIPVTSDLGTQPLPITQVILYSSGVGYFQREGEIEGTSRIDLSFQVDDINDLLKSMVLQDLDGGHISAVSYDGQAPIERTLRSFSLDLTGNPSFAQILNQARGEKVEVVLQQSNVTQPGTITGTIMGVESQKQPVGQNAVADVSVLNLWCAEGIRGVKLGDVQRLRFLNPIMESEVKKALEVLSLTHDTQKKTVSLNCVGEGTRQIRVSYVVENSIWKTSYRLVLDKEGKPFLQGWAIVENPSDEDWNNVRMALVSGRPISFRMNLYDALFIPRPLVEPELFASLRPVAYGGSMHRWEEDGLAKADRAAPMDEKRRANMNMLRGVGAPQAASAPGGLGGGGAFFEREQLERNWGLDQGISSVATASQMGDFFQYIINHPVSLPRQKSAMLPIVNQNVEGQRVSIYNQSVQAKFPLLGLKFKNSTDMHLM